MPVLAVFIYYGGWPLGVFIALHACKEGIHFNAKFWFNWLFNEVKHILLGLRALIRGEHALLGGRRS